jgi:DNA-binding transcriptional regulator PaaX
MSDTRALLFGIFVVVRRELMTPELVALGRPLGISPTNVKSHLSRMVAEGALERAGPPRGARYRPSSSQEQVVQGIAARLEEASSEPWDGKWILLALKLPAHRGERERIRASLWFDGFRPWDGSTFIRPAWPKRWALARARWYLARIPGLAVRGPFIEEPPVSAIYELDELDREAQRLARRLRETRIPRGSPPRAFAARLKMGALVARLAGHDPRLPGKLWGEKTGMRDLVQAYRHFEARVTPGAMTFVEKALA